MKQYCVGCKAWHEPDVPCFDVTEQMKRDIGIRPPRGAGGGTGQLSARTVVLIFLAFIAVLLAGGLLYVLIL